MSSSEECPPVKDFAVPARRTRIKSSAATAASRPMRSRPRLAPKVAEPTDSGDGSGDNGKQLEECFLCLKPHGTRYHKGFLFGPECYTGTFNRHRLMNRESPGSADADVKLMQKDPERWRRSMMPYVFGNSKEKAAARFAAKTEAKSYEASEKVSTQNTIDDDKICTKPFYKKVRREESSEVETEVLEAEFDELYDKQKGKWQLPSGKPRVQYNGQNQKIRRTEGRENRSGVVQETAVDDDTYNNKRAEIAGKVKPQTFGPGMPSSSQKHLTSEGAAASRTLRMPGKAAPSQDVSDSDEEPRQQRSRSRSRGKRSRASVVASARKPRAAPSVAPSTRKEKAPKDFGSGAENMVLRDTISDKLDGFVATLDGPKGVGIKGSLQKTVKEANESGDVPEHLPFDTSQLEQDIDALVTKVQKEKDRLQKVQDSQLQKFDAGLEALSVEIDTLDGKVTQQIQALKYVKAKGGSRKRQQYMNNYWQKKKISNHLAAGGHGVNVSSALAEWIAIMDTDKWSLAECAELQESPDAKQFDLSKPARWKDTDPLMKPLEKGITAEQKRMDAKFETLFKKLEKNKTWAGSLGAIDGFEHTVMKDGCFQTGSGVLTGSEAWMYVFMRNAKRFGPSCTAPCGVPSITWSERLDWMVAYVKATTILECGCALTNFENYANGDDGWSFLQEHMAVVPMRPGEKIYIPADYVVHYVSYKAPEKKAKKQVLDKDELCAVVSMPMPVAGGAETLDAATKKAMLKFYETGTSEKSGQMWERRREFMNSVLGTV